MEDLESGFQDQLSLNAGQKYCRMLQESILQFFQPSLNCHLSLRSLFCLFVSGCFTQVLLYIYQSCRYLSVFYYAQSICDGSNIYSIAIRIAQILSFGYFECTVVVYCTFLVIQIKDVNKMSDIIKSFASLLFFLPHYALTLYLLVLSADDFCKQFGPRSGPQKVGPDLDPICLTLSNPENVFRKS